MKTEDTSSAFESSKESSEKWVSSRALSGGKLWWNLLIIFSKGLELLWEDVFSFFWSSTFLFTFVSFKLSSLRDPLLESSLEFEFRFCNIDEDISLCPFLYLEISLDCLLLMSDILLFFVTSGLLTAVLPPRESLFSKGVFSYFLNDVWSPVSTM